MKVVDPKTYQDWKNKNLDPYGAAVFRFLERWANLMEEQIEKGLKVEDVAKATTHKDDDEGITGFMYGCAVDILAHCWVYGDELRRWHNLDVQIRDEGVKANEKGGTLNPALLMIGE